MTTPRMATGPADGIPDARAISPRTGWLAVVGALVGFMFSYATLGVLVLSLLTEPLTSTFGWQRSQISVALLIFIATAVVFAWPLGALMDRYGVRRFLLPSLVLFGAVLWSMSHFTGSIEQLFGSYVLLGLFGAATLPNSYTRVVVGWFDRNRGLALGVAASGAAIGMVVLPPAITAILVSFGWRQVYVACAAAMLLLCLPVVALLLRESPATRRVGPAVVGSGSLFAEAVRTKVFMLMVFAFCLLGFGTIGVVPHLVPMLLDAGEAPMAAAQVLSIYGLAAVAGRLVCGYCLDRFFAPHVAAVSASAPAMACVLLAMDPGYGMFLVAAVLIGLGAGAELDLMAYMISRYLGVAKKRSRQ